MTNDQLPMADAGWRPVAHWSLYHWDLVIGEVAPVAQSDRAAGFEPAGREFNPLRARHTRMTSEPMTNAFPETLDLIGIWSLRIGHWKERL